MPIIINIKTETLSSFKNINSFYTPHDYFLFSHYFPFQHDEVDTKPPAVDKKHEPSVSYLAAYCSSFRTAEGCTWRRCRLRTPGALTSDWHPNSWTRSGGSPASPSARHDTCKKTRVLPERRWVSVRVRARRNSPGRCGCPESWSEQCRCLTGPVTLKSLISPARKMRKVSEFSRYSEKFQFFFFKPCSLKVALEFWAHSFILRGTNWKRSHFKDKSPAFSLPSPRHRVALSWCAACAHASHPRDHVVPMPRPSDSAQCRLCC